MNRGANSVSLPNDLITEILSRLPVKSIRRFQCVSKLWNSILCRQYFTELFHTRSSSYPRLLTGVVRVFGELSCDILTLETGKMRWRNIQCPLRHYPHFWCEGICINGVLYYLTQPTGQGRDVIGCFDVRSEKFKYLNLNSDCPGRTSSKLINYRGKLGVINFEDGYSGGFPRKLGMWVLEDVEKHEWTTYAYTLKAQNKVKDNDYFSIYGVTALGEIVLAKRNAYKPCYVFYFNPEKNTLLSVEIQGVREGEELYSYHKVYYFVDHVEDLRFDVMKPTYAATSISQPEQSTSTSSREDHDRSSS
ncbi:hypothetical protein CARUB_v10012503mg [Capsella rubella]|uniref:F-box domain-containing protein n=1 Tax=Capsella rubella TaxID=81985 RepID=R0I5Z7_9BRAS|nr:hypothetical protein CARUB_v10012503mg [Capsella rubella]